jgi:hypothetical protein
MQVYYTFCVPAWKHPGGVHGNGTVVAYSSWKQARYIVSSWWDRTTAPFQVFLVPLFVTYAADEASLNYLIYLT